MLYDLMRTNFQALLDIRFLEGTGTAVNDFAKPHHLCTCTGAPTWASLALNNLNVLDFNPATPDYIIIAAAAAVDINFTAGDFSLGVWIEPDALGVRNPMTKGVHETDGYAWQIQGDGSMSLYTSQAWAHQVTHSVAGDIVVNTWQFIVATRDGANVRLYTNGIDVTGTYGVHIDPVSAVANNFYIGVNDAAGAAWYDGAMWRPRVWGRALPIEEIGFIFDMERDLLGV